MVLPSRDCLSYRAPRFAHCASEWRKQRALLRTSEAGTQTAAESQGVQDREDFIENNEQVPSGLNCSSSEELQIARACSEVAETVQRLLALPSAPKEGDADREKFEQTVRAFAVVRLSTSLLGLRSGEVANSLSEELKEVVKAARPLEGRAEGKEERNVFTQTQSQQLQARYQQGEQEETQQPQPFPAVTVSSFIACLCTPLSVCIKFLVVFFAVTK